ncbi:MAG: NDP-sugar synthase [Oscillospiraceae bacterium]|nr:NDP-sugar synthase [Oscillospiraceae bacterium]
MKALILAGGYGTRLMPLTANKPKPMIPILNKPVILHIIEHLKANSIKSIAVAVSHLSEKITGYLSDGSGLGVSITYFYDKEPLGTAGCVKNAAPFLDGRFIVVSGDSFTDIDLREAAAFHDGHGALGTLILKRMGNAKGCGVVETDGDMAITRFEEKPRHAHTGEYTVNTGIYIFEPAILERIPPNVRFDFAKDLFTPRHAVDGYKGYVAEGYWSDVGSLRSYLDVHVDILRKGYLGAGDRRRAVTRGRGCVIHDESVVEGPCVLGDDVTIGPGCAIGPYAVVGEGTSIGRGCHISRSILWDGCVVGEGSCLKDTVISSGRRIGAHSKVRKAII